MNKSSLYAFLSFFFLSLTGCSELREIDLAEVTLCVELRDPSGVDLLNAATPGNVLGEEINVIYHGNVYNLEGTENSRIAMNWFYGIMLVNKPIGESYLRIGGFSGHSTHEECWLCVGENRYLLSFDAKMKKDGDLKWRKFYIDGKQSKGDIVNHFYTICL